MVPDRDWAWRSGVNPHERRWLDLLDHGHRFWCLPVLPGSTKEVQTSGIEVRSRRVGGVPGDCAVGCKKLLRYRAL